MTTPTPLRFPDFMAWLRAKPKTWRDNEPGTRCAVCPVALWLREVTGLPWCVGSRGCWVAWGSFHAIPPAFRSFINRCDASLLEQSRDALLAIAERIQAEEAA